MTALEALAGGRWRTLTILEQMGNIGSEVERTIRAHGAGRQDRFEHALERELELFDMTAADDRWRGPRRREILRAREEFCRLFFERDSLPTRPSGYDSEAGLRRYFLYYARAARRA